ncbi:MAG: helix-turn-helix domain-containing protein [Hyphomicrobiaceae bacterium]
MSESARPRSEKALREPRQPDTVDRQVACRIMEIRKQRGISREDLAERIGVSMNQVIKYEQGANRVSASRMQELANALDVDVTTFFSSDPIGEPAAPAQLSAVERRLLEAFRRIPLPETRSMVIRMVALVADGANQTKEDLPDLG